MGEGFDAIVIGSGIGGISAAAVLARKGIRPLVLEQHFAPGGNAQTFRRHKQFDFDVGLHYIGDCGSGGLFDNLLGQMGIAGQLEFLPMDQDGFDTLRFPDMEFRVPAGWERYHQRLRETFPDEARAVDRYIEHLRAVATTSAEETAVDRVLRKRRDQTTLGEVFDALEIGHRLRNVLSAESGLYAAPPSRAALGMHAGVMDHYMHGAYFVKGGSRALVDAILGAIEAGGGELRLRSRVRRIIIEKGKAVGVELATGEEIRAPLVVSNADAKRTLLQMVGEEHLSPQLRDHVKEYRMALPLFIVYMAMEVDPSELGIPNTNFFLMPGYDIEEEYAACYDGKVPEKPWVYISTASVKDPESRNLAPEGYTNLQLMTLAPAQLASWGASMGPADGGRYRHTPDYVAAREEMERRVIDVTNEMMPGFLRKIVWQECATPLTQERFTRSTGGTSYGLEHTPDQSGAARVAPRSEIPNLWMVGASGVFGHGIAGAMVSGCATAAMIVSTRPAT
jgi:all-trans-retinol 13,14-reductase